MRELSRSPLTFGQLSAWRSIEHLPAERATSAILHGSWPLPADRPVSAVRYVLDLLERRHESLRTTYARGGAHGVEQVVHEADGVPVDIVDLGADADERADEIAAELARAPFALDVERPWRVRVVMGAGRPRRLALAVHHMTADAASIAILRRELIGALTGDLPTDEAPRCRDIAVEQRSDRWAARRSSALSYWERVVSAASQPPVPAVPAGTPKRWTVLRSTALTEAVAELTARLAVSTQAVLYAAFCRALAEHVGHDALLLALFAGNRLNPRWRNLVSSLNQVIPMLARVESGESLGQLARRMNAESLATYRHACYDVDSLADLEREHGYNGVGRGFRYFFNFVPHPGGPPGRTSSAMAEPWTLETGSRGRDNGFPCYLLVNDGAPMTCTLREVEGPEAMGDALLLRLQDMVLAEAASEVRC
ncbi:MULTISPECIES: condensation domain-containing protein [unclassified Micromonospora]|uniref:condensation domain-containing protein n=1 Tax=unclassified Micromonospora TaxID=2617518 RepID=UPI002FF2F926